MGGKRYKKKGTWERKHIGNSCQKEGGLQLKKEVNPGGGGIRKGGTRESLREIILRRH